LSPDFGLFVLKFSFAFKGALFVEVPFGVDLTVVPLVIRLD